jgi:ubiquinone/menaquinone biosynthesis C-methylase UbiE
MTDATSIIGYGPQEYANRVDGYSPEYVRDSVLELFGKDIKGDILDAGSGDGGWIQRLQRSCDIQRVVSIDFVDDGASQIPGIEFHLADLSVDQLPCGDNEFDWMFAVEVLEHLANPRNFVKDSARCLRKGGKFIITTPSNESIRAKLSYLTRGYYPAFCENDYHLSGHIMPILEIDIQRMAKEAGFERVDCYYPTIGLMPRVNITWQQLFPWLKGKNWSDSLVAVFTK